MIRHQTAAIQPKGETLSRPSSLTRTPPTCSLLKYPAAQGIYLLGSGAWRVVHVVPVRPLQTQSFSAFIHQNWRASPESDIRLRTASIKRDGDGRTRRFTAGTEITHSQTETQTYHRHSESRFACASELTQVRTPSDDRHFDVSGIAETWERPAEFVLARVPYRLLSETA
jgi:hypothetical protein